MADNLEPHDTQHDKPHDKQRERRDHPTRDWGPLVAGLVLLGAVGIFVVQNGDDVTLEFLAFEGTLPLGAALLLAAVLGGLASLLLGFVRRARTRIQLRRS